ncbi:ABC-type glycerol-3-phosphate transport system substrate-binding protein [Marmoricola sp. OAE513]|uniref:hypothetical protein n=1 Tax=Marmoricola sp. OAE513 TaxID=2817894 RepID=UPI001AE8A778
MRLVLIAAALSVVAGCSGSTQGDAADGSAGPSSAGTVALRVLCPEVHTAVDGLVASSPASQHAFVEALERLSSAGTAEARQTLTPLVDAAEALEEAGVGPDFYAARDGIHPAVQRVDSACVAVGSPILHAGPH